MTSSIILNQRSQALKQGQSSEGVPTHPSYISHAFKQVQIKAMRAQIIGGNKRSNDQVRSTQYKNQETSFIIED